MRFSALYSMALAMDQKMTFSYKEYDTINVYEIYVEIKVVR